MGQENRSFDIKQVVSTAIGILFAGGLVLLVGVHIGKRVETETPQEQKEATETVPQEVVGAASNEADYRFFELLEAPAPKRALPEVELAPNPALDPKVKKEKEAERKKAKKEAKKKAKKKASEEKVAKPKTEKKAKKAAPKASPEPKKEKAVAKKSTKEEAPKKVSKAAAPAKEKAKPKKAKAKEEKPSPKAAKQSKTEKKSGTYTVQISAFQDKSVAKDLAADFERRGYSAQVKREEIPGRGIWYRVRVGKFSNRAAAEREASSLKSKEGFAGFVTSY